MQNLILNRYRPLEKAGSGGFATVLAAWDTRIQRRVAIKCLRLDGYGTASSPTSARDIPGLEEARMAAMLSDPNIVGVYDFAVQGGVAYLILEYMDGMTLTELMRQEGELSLDAATCVLQSVARALEVAHTNQVLHLDIKPDNVLINKKGQVKVVDFGLAQLSHEAGYGQAAGGTIGYMPLEQMRLEAPDERTDEWALASLTYEMLLGENPFRAPDLASAERAIEDAEIVIPSIGREDLDEEIDEALFGALAIDREDRFETVALFADAMLAHMGDPQRGALELAFLVGGDPEDDLEGEPEEMEGAAAEEVGGAWFAEDDGRPSVRRMGKGRLAKELGKLMPRLWAALACCFAMWHALAGSPAAELIAGQEAVALVLAVVGLLVLFAVFPLVGGVCVVLAMVVAHVLAGSFSGAVVVIAAGAVWLALCWKKGVARALLSVVAAGVVFVAGTVAVLYVENGFVFQVPSPAEWLTYAGPFLFALAMCALVSQLRGLGRRGRS